MVHTINQIRRIPLSYLDHGPMIDLCRYWNASSASDPDCEPGPEFCYEDFLVYSRHAHLICAEGEGVFRYRYHASGANGSDHRDMTGKLTIDHRPRAYGRMVTAQLVEARKVGGAVAYAFSGACTHRCHHLVLPVKIKGCTRTCLIMMFDAHTRPFWPGRQPMVAAVRQEAFA